MAASAHRASRACATGSLSQPSGTQVDILNSFSLFAFFAGFRFNRISGSGDGAPERRLRPRSMVELSMSGAVESLDLPQRPFCRAP